ncbi:hypothetical protein [Psychrobacter sp. W2-37-MNA-CIBAN-0211]|uniref:hypothetical protein n=1 Tax=Psychrobacter sp. W2-37-MNA-CIBAN-0211 TaxID=3140443 RepID=UPI00332CCA3E
MNKYAQPLLRATNAPVVTDSPSQALKLLYGEVRAHKALLQCMYSVTIEDVFNIGAGIPWFNNKSLGYLVTDSDLSLGSSESESFYAGALQSNYLTQKTADDMELTFIETANGDIFKSFRACYELAFNDDGTVNEPKNYAFKLSIGLIDHENPSKPPVVKRSWLVAAKSGRADISAAGRSEIVKHGITIQKLRPLMFEY